MLSEGVVAGAPLLPPHGIPLNATEPALPAQRFALELRHHGLPVLRQYRRGCGDLPLPSMAGVWRHCTCHRTCLLPCLLGLHATEVNSLSISMYSYAHHAAR